MREVAKHSNRSLEPDAAVTRDIVEAMNDEGFDESYSKVQALLARMNQNKSLKKSHSMNISVYNQQAHPRPEEFDNHQIALALKEGIMARFLNPDEVKIKKKTILTRDGPMDIELKPEIDTGITKKMLK